MMPLGNWNGHNNNSSFCVPSLPRNSQASELQSILLAGHVRRPAKCSLRQLRCCGDRRLASKLEMIQKNKRTTTTTTTWDDTKEQGGRQAGELIQRLCPVHTCWRTARKRQQSLTRTDHTKVTSYSSICITGPASAPRFNREKKRHARHQKINWESLKR